LYQLLLAIDRVLYDKLASKETKQELN